MLTGRFLWNIILSAIYYNNIIYNVKGSFLARFGRLPDYWLAMICAVVAALMYNIAIITLRVTFFPKDADVFAELEKDPLIKARFEEEAASELQQGWNGGKPAKDKAVSNHPLHLEEGKALRRDADAWSSTAKLRTSDDDDDPEPSAVIAGTSVFDGSERRGSLTHTGCESGHADELGQQFDAEVRKSFKRMPPSEAP
jgi:hypothetical protein